MRLKKRKFAGRGSSRTFQLGFHQDGPVLFQIFLHGRYTTAMIGDSDGVGLGQFVMYQQFTHHSYLKIHFWHAPYLAGYQWLRAKAARRLDFSHA